MIKSSPYQTPQALAHQAVAHAIRAGRLAPIETQTCANCGKSAVLYHHDNGYDGDQQLNVMALCATCHRHQHTGRTSKYDKVNAGYITINAAARQLRVSRSTLQKMLARMGITVYHDPRDARVKLIRVEDVERLAQPIESSE